MHSMEITEIIFAKGHRNIQGIHKSTLEITKENKLSKKGECIIAVSADKALADLSQALKGGLRKKNSEMIMLIEAGGIVEVVNALGCEQLILTHPTDIVVRKSSYVCSRTLAIKADKAAWDLSRKLVERLMDPKQKVKVTLTLKV